MKNLRAVIYNRCSTEEESQRDALLKQVQEAKNCVQEQGWILVDSYVEAKSGTTSKGRREYNRLFQDLESDKFDVIVIKSQDRLMRNTKDWYLFLDCMQRNAKRLYMYLDRKFYTPDDSLITGIKAILAEDYSRELSKKINNAHRNRQKEGRSFVLTNQTYGFRKRSDKTIEVDEKEASMIRTAFQMSADGYGTHVISELLYQQGYRNRRGEKIAPSVIRKLIRNRLYKGDVVQNKGHYDFDSKRYWANPQEEWIIHKGVLPAIVDDELFEAANYGMDLRRDQGKKNGKYIKYSKTGQYHLSGKIICGLCGNTFYRTFRDRKELPVVEWKCCNYLMNGRKAQNLQRRQIRKVQKNRKSGCDNIHLDEEKLFHLLEDLSGKQKEGFPDQKELVNETLVILRKALHNTDSERERKEYQEKRERLLHQKDVLLQKLLDEIVTDADFKEKNKEIQEKLQSVQQHLERFEAENLHNKQLERRLEDIKQRLEGGLIEKAKAANFIESVKYIKVFPEYLEIFFDSWAILGLEDSWDTLSINVRKETDQLTVIRIPQVCSTSRQPLIEEEKMQILDCMKQRPEITAKQIAEKIGINISSVNRRIRDLRKEGKVCYSTPNGRGHWIILEEGTPAE